MLHSMSAGPSQGTVLRRARKGFLFLEGKIMQQLLCPRCTNEAAEQKQEGGGMICHYFSFILNSEF